MPDGFVGQVLAFRARLTGEKPGSGLLPSPVFAQCFEEPGTERHIAVLAAFAFMNMDDHALAVDVVDAQANQFAAPHPGRIQSHQDGARLQSACRIDQASDFVRAQYARRSMMRVLRVRYGVDR